MWGNRSFLPTTGGINHFDSIKSLLLSGAGSGLEDMRFGAQSDLDLLPVTDDVWSDVVFPMMPFFSENR